MIKQVKLEAVYFDKQMVKKGTPEEKEIDKVTIKLSEAVTTDEGIVSTDSRLSTFKINGTEGFREGQEVTIDIIKNGDFWNFAVPSVSLQRVEDLEKRVTVLEGGTPDTATPDTATPDPEDIPL